MIGVTEKQKSKLSDNILAIQRTDDLMGLADAYSSADIFLNPSVEETFGMVSLEALACGTQVISNKYSANPELITDQCGIVVDDITTELYMSAINELKINPKNKQDCIKKAEQYNENNCHQKYLNLYEEIIRGI